MKFLRTSLASLAAAVAAWGLYHAGFAPRTAAGKAVDPGAAAVADMEMDARRKADKQATQERQEDDEVAALILARLDTEELPPGEDLPYWADERKRISGIEPPRVTRLLRLLLEGTAGRGMTAELKVRLMEWTIRAWYSGFDHEFHNPPYEQGLEIVAGVQPQLKSAGIQGRVESQLVDLTGAFQPELAEELFHRYSALWNEEESQQLKQELLRGLSFDKEPAAQLAKIDEMGLTDLHAAGMTLGRYCDHRGGDDYKDLTAILTAIREKAVMEAPSGAEAAWELRSGVLDGAAQELAERELSRAASWMEEAGLSGEEVAGMIGKIQLTWSSQDVGAWVERLDASLPRQEVLAKVRDYGESLGLQYDPKYSHQTAEKWAAALPAGEFRDEALAAYSGRVKDRAAALQAAGLASGATRQAELRAKVEARLGQPQH